MLQIEVKADARFFFRSVERRAKQPESHERAHICFWDISSMLCEHALPDVAPTSTVPTRFFFISITPDSTGSLQTQHEHW